MNHDVNETVANMLGIVGYVCTDGWPWSSDFKERESMPICTWTGVRMHNSF